MKLSIKFIPETVDDALNVNLVNESGATTIIATLNYSVSEAVIDVDENTVLELATYLITAGAPADYIEKVIKEADKTEESTIDSDTQKVETVTTS